MSILDIKKENIVLILMTVITLVFSIIYELFSFGVYSFYMMFAFIIPLISIGINLLLIKYNIGIGKVSYNLFLASILTFTTMFLIKGILDIYGTSNILVIVYLIVGIIFSSLSVLFYKK